MSGQKKLDSIQIKHIRGAIIMRKILWTAALAATLGVAAPAMAQSNGVEVKSSNFVEKTVTDAAGKKKTTLASTDLVVPGDIVLFTHDYANKGSAPATGFLINNPLSAQIEFVDSPDANLVVSVDGGKTFGKLSGLKVAGRAATASDVTNLRWTFGQAIAPGAKGKVSFRGRLK